MGEFAVERSATINASSSRVHGLVNDFHEWTAWSPWEDVDPALHRTYSGPDAGVGARYAWSGNRKAGAGTMEIIESTPEGIDIALEFLKPFKASNRIRMSFAEADQSTGVVWRMTGEHTGLMTVLGKFMNMDKMVGPDFEKGLARLKGVAEQAG